MKLRYCAELASLHKTNRAKMKTTKETIIRKKESTFFKCQTENLTFMAKYFVNVTITSKTNYLNRSD